jgi:hypothetical protein
MSKVIDCVPAFLTQYTGNVTCDRLVGWYWSGAAEPDHSQLTASSLQQSDVTSAVRCDLRCDLSSQMWPQQSDVTSAARCDLSRCDLSSQMWPRPQQSDVTSAVRCDLDLSSQMWPQQPDVTCSLLMYVSSTIKDWVPFGHLLQYWCSIDPSV